MTVPTPRTIAVVRHGETDWNLARRIQGRTEVPLNATGRAQAAACGAQLAAIGAARGFEWRRVVSSPLGRAIETASIVTTTLGIAGPEIDEALWERDFGPAEGLEVDEAHSRWPNLEVPTAEPMAALTARTSTALTRILDTSPGSIVVAHGAMLRAGLGVFTGAPVPRIMNGEIWLLQREDGADRIRASKFEL